LRSAFEINGNFSAILYYGKSEQKTEADGLKAHPVSGT
jgi:hypothetical protein